MEIRVISMDVVSQFVLSHFSPVMGILFAGDRAACCDEAVGVFDWEAMVGVATVAPDGETGSGRTTIVGLYIDKAYRRRGIGRELFEAAINRCLERGLPTPILLDSMSSGMMAIINSLPPELLAHLEVNDHGGVLDWFVE